MIPGRSRLSATVISYIYIDLYIYVCIFNVLLLLARWLFMDHDVYRYKHIRMYLFMVPAQVPQICHAGTRARPVNIKWYPHPPAPAHPSYVGTRGYLRVRVPAARAGKPAPRWSLVCTLFLHHIVEYGNSLWGDNIPSSLVNTKVMLFICTCMCIWKHCMTSEISYSCFASNRLMLLHDQVFCFIIWRIINTA